MKTDHSLNRFLKRQRPLLEERLRKLVEIPTVSAVRAVKAIPASGFVGVEIHT
jgi:hypothetical protein